jgi:folate-dependent tRNA-U54 methylase TrmFO/GidA
MRPVARKLYSKLDDKGMSMDNVLEFFDHLNPAEKKQSFPDDCLFQKDRYFAETVLKEMMRAGMIKRDGNRYFKNIKKEKENKD